MFVDSELCYEIDCSYYCDVLSMCSHPCFLMITFSFFHIGNNRTPVASMALLYWIQFVIRETSYIETYFRSHEVPVPLLLIEEVESLLLSFFFLLPCHSFTAFIPYDNLVLIFVHLSHVGREGRRHKSALTLFSSHFGYSKPTKAKRRS